MNEGSGNRWKTVKENATSQVGDQGKNLDKLGKKPININTRRQKGEAARESHYYGKKKKNKTNPSSLIKRHQG